MARTVARRAIEIVTELRLALVTAKPSPPATGTIKMYVRKPVADVLLVAQLADGTEVTITTLVSGGNLP